jgi:hypothetical protein
MPVKAVGRRIIEVRTGKVVGTAKTPAKAKASARIRNQAHREKRGKKR